jgi:hypothetical protein
MRYVAIAVGLLLAGYGAVLIVLTSRLFARTDDAEQASKARWRRRRGLACILGGVVVLIIGGVVLPLSTQLVLAGPFGVLSLIFLNIVGLIFDLVGIVFVLMSGITLVEHHELDAHWLAQARRRIYLGIGALGGALIAQLLGLALYI